MQNYSRPPITEAVIQIRTTNPIALEKLKKIANKLKRNHYPNLNQRNNLNVNVKQDKNDLNAEIGQEFGDYHLASDDQADIVILHQNSILISRLAPYLGWESFYERFISVWKIWKEIVKSQEISRIGIRYINRIDIPIGESSKIDIEEYLNFYPKECLFTEIPMEDYFIQITKKTPNPLWSTAIISTQHPPILIGTISLLLDIDVFRTQETPLNDTDLLSLLTEARNIKNEIFGMCITRKTEELFN